MPVRSVPPMGPSSQANLFFKFNPEHSIAEMIETGVLNTFFHFKDECRIPFGEIREDIATTLLSLAAVDIPAPAKDKRTRQTRSRDLKFFSGRQKGVVEIFEDSETDKIAVERFPIGNSKPLRRTPKQLRNDRFKSNLAICIVDTIEGMRNKIVGTILERVFSILNLSEDCVGPFVDQFEKHKELFRQLARVYEKADVQSLDSEKGCYSYGIAIEESLKVIGDA